MHTFAILLVVTRQQNHVLGQWNTAVMLVGGQMDHNAAEQDEQQSHKVDENGFAGQVLQVRAAKMLDTVFERADSYCGAETSATYSLYCAFSARPIMAAAIASTYPEMPKNTWYGIIFSRIGIDINGKRNEKNPPSHCAK